MKFFIVFCLLAAVFMTGTDAQGYDACIICKPFIKFPETWDHAKLLLAEGCGELQEAKSACNGLLNAADLTRSYPQMLPYALSIKEIGCKYYCQE
ncbi:hypothetical protein CAEBREN_07355 [Caenorhabditis brenneri]|uniref:Saposin B-type domain-containing protein n=1 Tax=Caenorhabditis brenneri TaxID=135651 RepID=G0PCG6_CAEBE|nr:hypothetical protein CAEBREN_07355 [Caenorhabditis brenneri]